MDPSKYVEFLKGLSIQYFTNHEIYARQREIRNFAWVFRDILFNEGFYAYILGKYRFYGGVLEPEDFKNVVYMGLYCISRREHHKLIYDKWYFMPQKKPRTYVLDTFRDNVEFYMDMVNIPDTTTRPIEQFENNVYERIQFIYSAIGKGMTQFLSVNAATSRSPALRSIFGIPELSSRIAEEVVRTPQPILYPDPDPAEVNNFFRDLPCLNPYPGQ